MFKPQFNWTHAVIHKQALPVVIWSVNPYIHGKEPIIAEVKVQMAISKEPQYIIQATTATDLAIAAQQYTKKAEIPKEYHEFAKVFSKEESK